MGSLAEFVTEAARAAGYKIDGPRAGGRVQLAEAAGISAASISRILMGRTGIAPASVPGLAAALDVPVSSLLVASGLVRSPGDLTDPAGETESVGMSPVSAAVIAELRALRKELKVSAQQLADRMTEAGYPVKRSVIANLESGRRAEVSIDHVAIAAKALGVDVSALVRRVTEPCPHCKGEPPSGFTCNTCSTTGGVA